MLIILDRDGVINYESVNYIKNPDEWRPYPRSLQAISELTAAKHTIVIATNQAGVGRGLYTLDSLRAIHEKMIQAVTAQGGAIDRIYYCPHHPQENCQCRKPKPGMLLTIAQDYPQLFTQAIFIGDSWRDYKAAQAAGCQFSLVKTGNGKETLASSNLPQSINIYEDLLDFTQQLTQTTPSKQL